MRSHSSFMAVLGLSVLTSVVGVTQADWRGFRGNDSTGVVADTKVPAKWGDEGIAWKADLPGRGLSGPIIVGQKVFVTASSGYDQNHLHVLCFDSATGKSLWERDFLATGRTMCHNKMSVATPTPCSDGKHVFAFFSSNDVICLDLDGNLKWLRGLTLDYPNASNSLGMASSPLVIGDTLILQVENDSESFACGLDVATGINRWKTDRPVMSNWTSPTVLKGKSGDDDVVVLQSGKGLSAIKPYSGEEVWNFGGGCSTIPSHAVQGDKIYAPSNGLVALTATPGEKAPKTLWQSRLAPGTPSPIVVGDYVYTVNSAGVLNGADIKKGEAIKALRLPGSGSLSATPVASEDRLYLVRENGLVVVVKGGAEPAVLSSYDFKETILATPAIADGALWLRSDGHLWKIGSK